MPKCSFSSTKEALINVSNSHPLSSDAVVNFLLTLMVVRFDLGSWLLRVTAWILASFRRRQFHEKWSLLPQVNHDKYFWFRFCLGLECVLLHLTTLSPLSPLVIHTTFIVFRCMLTWTHTWLEHAHQIYQKLCLFLLLRTISVQQERLINWVCIYWRLVL